MQGGSRRSGEQSAEHARVTTTPPCSFQSPSAPSGQAPRLGLALWMSSELSLDELPHAPLSSPGGLWTGTGSPGRLPGLLDQQASSGLAGPQHTPWFPLDSGPQPSGDITAHAAAAAQTAESSVTPSGPLSPGLCLQRMPASLARSQRSCPGPPVSPWPAQFQATF